MMRLSKYAKIGWCLMLCLGIAQAVLGQTELPRPKYIAVERNFWGMKYIYERQTIENPLALQIPLLQMQDPEVSSRFLKFKSQRKAMQWVNIASAGVSLYTIFNRDKVSNNFYWTSLGSALVITTYLNFRSTIHLSKSIARYNQLQLQQSRIGLSINQTSVQTPVIGLGWTQSF
ncbi:MAG: hypothetical protein ACOVQ4_20315 [Flectobacillus sp.]|uniref:hypothetical protein n=1 Tax=Flectobacillus sp. TaxID=50419 RepID=UPI003B98ED7A